MELLNCNYKLDYWKYDSELNLVETSNTNQMYSETFFEYVGFRKMLRNYLEEGHFTPLLLEAEVGLLWIAGFRFSDALLSDIYLIGPILSGKDSHLILRKKLNSYDLSVKLRVSLFKLFEEISPVPFNIILQYATMLHYCLNQEKISTPDVSIQNRNTSSREKEVKFKSSSHPGVWFNEQRFCKMLSEGDPRYAEALQKMKLSSYGMKINLENVIRSHKNNSIVLLTLCSRACINGGLSPDTSYDLNDYYGEKIEQCTTLSDISKVNSEMLKDYVSRVQEVRQNSEVSNLIRNTCEYIKSHLNENIALEELASRAGYTGYYFSHKFKKEMGCTVSEYILNEKIEQAKLLLCGTTEGIQSISDHLSFSNRSYFYTCFQKKTGMSPSEYRNRHQKCL